jgi:outer membrane lipopolysaccharide assembly protein LptE/RlpB
MKKTLSLLFFPLILSSCGYQPLYAPAGENLAFHRVEVGTVEASNVKLLPGERRAAQRVAQKLRIDYPDAAATLDVLDINITEQTATLAVQKTATTARAEIMLNAHAKLTSPEGKVLLATDINASSAYNVEDSPYSTESSKDFARLVAADNLATEISRRVALYYAHPTPVPTAAELQGPKPKKHHTKL